MINIFKDIFTDNAPIFFAFVTSMSNHMSFLYLLQSTKLSLSYILVMLTSQKNSCLLSPDMIKRVLKVTQNP